MLQTVDGDTAFGCPDSESVCEEGGVAGVNIYYKRIEALLVSLKNSLNIVLHCTCAQLG